MSVSDSEKPFRMPWCFVLHPGVLVQRNQAEILDHPFSVWHAEHEAKIRLFVKKTFGPSHVSCMFGELFEEVLISRGISQGKIITPFRVRYLKILPMLQIVEELLVLPQLGSIEGHEPSV